MKWFRVETDHVDNEKIWDLFETHGIGGYGFYFWLINALHKQEESGYQIEATDRWIRKTARDLFITDKHTIVRYLDTLTEIGLINSQLWAEKIICSDGILERADAYMKSRIKEREKKRSQREKIKEEAESTENSLVSPGDKEGTLGDNANVPPAEIRSRSQISDPEDQEKKEKSTANADASPSEKKKTRSKPKKGPPKKLTKSQCESLVEIYHRLKPDLWAEVQSIGGKRLDMADRAYQVCDRDIEATKKIVAAALRYIATQQWWTERKFTFGTIFERGNKGQGDYRFIRWAELAPEAAKSRATSDGRPTLSDKQFQELRALAEEDFLALSAEEAMLVDPSLKVDITPDWERNVRVLS